MLSYLVAALLAFATLACGIGAAALARDNTAASLLLASFGLLAGLLAAAVVRGARTGAAVPPPGRFVPHRFLMSALVLAAVLILAAIVIPRLLF